VESKIKDCMHVSEDYRRWFLWPKLKHLAGRVCIVYPWQSVPHATQVMLILKKINLLSYRKLKRGYFNLCFFLKRIRLFHFQPCLPEAKNRCCFPVIQTKQNGSFFIVSTSNAILTGPFSKTESILSKSYWLDYYSRGQHSPTFTFQASCVADDIFAAIRVISFVCFID